MRALPVIGGLAALGIVWEAIARLGPFGAMWPAPAAVLRYIAGPGHGALLGAAFVRTGAEALAGLATGTAIAIALASTSVLFPATARGLGALASIVNGIPVIAVAGVCVLALPRDATPVVVAALAVTFIVFVGATAALAQAPAAQRDLFAALGASRRSTFARLAVPAAIPMTLDAIRSAAPSAVVGAIVGEWFAAERGLGPLLVSAMQNYAIAQLWAAALAGTLLSVAFYGAAGAVRAAAGARLA